LVHRLFQRRADPVRPDDDLVRAVLDAMRPADVVDAADPAVTAREVVALYRALRARPDVAALLASGECYYEVPLSFLDPNGSGACVRGFVDCLVAAPDGALTVLEFKTGQPRPEHEAQARLYALGLEAVLGAGPVRALVCYP